MSLPFSADLSISSDLSSPASQTLRSPIPLSPPPAWLHHTRDDSLSSPIHSHTSIISPSITTINKNSSPTRSVLILNDREDGELEVAEEEELP